MMFSNVAFAIYMIKRYHDNNWILILNNVVFNGKLHVEERRSIGRLPRSSRQHRCSFNFRRSHVTVVHQCAIEALLVFAFSLYLLVGLDSTTVR